jgi:hypothetical protein
MRIQILDLAKDDLIEGFHFHERLGNSGTVAEPVPNNNRVGQEYWSIGSAGDGISADERGLAVQDSVGGGGVGRGVPVIRLSEDLGVRCREGLGDPEPTP